MPATVAAATVVCVASFAQEPPHPAPGDVTSRAAAYVRHFEQAFGVVIADETYRQDLSTPGLTEDSRQAGPVQREIRVVRDIISEMLFLWERDAETWLGVRHVLRYSDTAGAWTWARDNHMRLDTLLKNPTDDPSERLRKLADDSARLNIGRMVRNFAAPTFTIQFLDPSYGSRFEFTTAGMEKMGDAGETIKVAFRERTTPTVIRSDAEDLLASGYIWIRPDDGAVVRTRLMVSTKGNQGTPGVDARVDVEYRRHRGFDVLVPAMMNEWYRERIPKGESVECRASYSIFGASKRPCGYFRRSRRRVEHNRERAQSRRSARHLCIRKDA